MEQRMWKAYYPVNFKDQKLILFVVTVDGNDPFSYFIIEQAGHHFILS